MVVSSQAIWIAPSAGQVQVVPRLPGAGDRRGGRLGTPRGLGPHGVERRRRAGSESGCVQGRGKNRGAAVGTGRDGSQALGAVVHRVHGGQHGRQHLRGADVAGGLLPADVLLPGLQREPVGGLAVSVDRDADQAPRELAAQLVPYRDVAGVRAAEAHRQPEPLGAADRDVGPHLPRRTQQRESEQVGGHRGLGAALVRGLDHRAQVTDGAGRPRVLKQHAEQLTVRLAGDQLGGDVGDDQLDAERFGPGAQHGEGLRQAVGVGEEDVPPADGAAGQRHGFRGGRRLVQQRRPGHRQRGQVSDHRLEVQQGLQPPLRDLRLIGGVGGVPARVFQHVAADDGRGDGAVVAQPDHRGQDLVTPRETAQLSQRASFGEGRGQVKWRGGGDRRQRGLGELIERGVADGGEHLLLLVR